MVACHREAAEARLTEVVEVQDVVARVSRTGEVEAQHMEVVEAQDAVAEVMHILVIRGHLLTRVTDLPHTSHTIVCTIRQVGTLPHPPMMNRTGSGVVRMPHHLSWDSSLLLKRHPQVIPV